MGRGCVLLLGPDAEPPSDHYPAPFDARRTLGGVLAVLGAPYFRICSATGLGLGDRFPTAMERFRLDLPVGNQLGNPNHANQRVVWNQLWLRQPPARGRIYSRLAWTMADICGVHGVDRRCPMGSYDLAVDPTASTLRGLHGFDHLSAFSANLICGSAHKVGVEFQPRNLKA